MKRTRLISAILALTVALCVALSGCADDSGNSSGTPGGKKNEDANEYYVSKLEMVTRPTAPNTSRAKKLSTRQA